MKTSHFSSMSCAPYAEFAPSPHLTRSAEAAPTSAEDLISAGHDTWTELHVRQQAWSDLRDEVERDSKLLVTLIVNRAVREPGLVAFGAAAARGRPGYRGRSVQRLVRGLVSREEGM